jgi:IS30 family transposase
MSYKHITLSQTNEIAVLLRTKTKQKEIAKIIGVVPSAISQEINRNKDKDGVYRARNAKAKRKSRRIEANQRFRKIENNSWLKRHINHRLEKKRWSPEQISGRLKIYYPHDKSRWIGKDSIYDYVYTERKDLVKYLRCKKGKYRRRKGARIREKQREEAKVKRIDTRPKVVEERSRIGDWEGDTIIGKDRNSRLITNVDRRSGKGLIDKINTTTAEIVQGKLERRFNKIPSTKKHTYTYDNGKEVGGDDEHLEDRIKMDMYRAFAYHSWERGCNENFNGLVREFFSKGVSFVNMSDEEVRKVEKLLNTRPRKRLNYCTPNEVFNGKDFEEFSYLFNSDLE